MAANTTPRLIDHMRGVRYGEVLAVYVKGTVLEAEVYGTQMLNDCPAELWDTLDAGTIAAEMGAAFVKLNGPRHWMLDGLGTKVATIEPVMREFNGLLMRRIATIDPYHLIFAIWATTQHYADFDVQVRAVLGEKIEATRGAETALTALFRDGLRVR